MSDKKERNNLQITAEILRLAKEGNGAGATRVQYGANLSWDLTKEYLGHMVSGGLLIIEGSNTRKRYRPTEKGKDWLWTFDLLMEKTPEQLVAG